MLTGRILSVEFLPDGIKKVPAALALPQHRQLLQCSDEQLIGMPVGIGSFNGLLTPVCQ